VKMLRLQLAMERRDRGVALQTFDELVDLDARIAAFLGQMPPDEALEPLAREADEQHAKLVHEKFGLAAGLMRRSAEPEPREWVEVREAPAALIADVQDCNDAGAPPVLDLDAHDRVSPHGRWALLVGAAVLALLATAAAALHLLGWEPATFYALLERRLVR
jgi:hypothetical protein